MLFRFDYQIVFFLAGVWPAAALVSTISPTDKSCLIDNYVPLSPNLMYGFNGTYVPRLYPDLEAFLQVYKQYVFRCNGWVKGVILFPAQAEVPRIFRMDSLDTKFLVMVNSTSIRDVIPPRGNRTWFYYEFPKPIEGTAGDFIGIYYDNWRTVYSDLVIRSVNDEAMPWVSPYITDDTLIFKLDSRLVAPGASMDITIAEVRRRLPAMAFHIVPYIPTTPAPTTPPPPSLPGQCALEMLPDDINCGNRSIRYRYSTTQRRCSEFLGCDTMSTSNNFPSARECLALCVWPFSTTPAPVSPGANDDTAGTDPRCSQQLTIDDTNCDSPTDQRWNFNPFYGQCRPFLGCDRGFNGNNWESEYQCKASCMQGNSTDPAVGDSRCSSDATLGQWLCLYKEPRYYWDKDATTCKQFYGCPYRNNMGFPIGNNFASYITCIGSCSSLISTPSP